MWIRLLMKNFYPIVFVLAALLIGGCDEPYPMDSVSSLAKETYTVGDTSYLEISPPITGFLAPSVLYVGNDNLLYVVDSTRIVMMNFAGIMMGERSIDKPSAIAQDWKLDLIVGGVVQRNTGGATTEVPALFRIHLLDSTRQIYHDLAHAYIDTIRVETSRPNRRYVGIGVFPDNSYIVARTGPDNSSPIDPDTRVMMFSKADKYVTPITDLATGVGNGIQYINQLTTLITFPSSRNFLLGQQQTGVAYGVLWMVYQKSEDFDGWQPKFNPTTSSGANIDFIRPYRFVYPAGLAVDNNRLDVFVADAGLDSVMKFNSKGAFKKESFGSAKIGHPLHPSGAAFFDRTLYISDKSQGCIFRFKLSTDF